MSLPRKALKLGIAKIQKAAKDNPVDVEFDFT
jgi:hypothetical protein